jgi:hypothetical protein
MSSNNNNTATATEKVQDAGKAVYDTTAGYVQQAGETTKETLNGARQYVSETVAPPKSPTAAEKIQEGAQDAKDKVAEAATDASERVSTFADVARKNVSSTYEDAKERVEGQAKDAREEIDHRVSGARQYASDTASRVREGAEDARKEAGERMDTAADRARAVQADVSGENDGFMKGYPRVTSVEKSIVSAASTGFGLGFRSGRFVLSKVGLDKRVGGAITYVRSTSANTFETVGGLKSAKETVEQYWPVRLAERMVSNVDANVREQLSAV